jgi:hypothetical protein
MKWLRRKPAQSAESAGPSPLDQIRSISNADLTESDIPGEGAVWEWPEIPVFAASFNGYTYWGSFEKCFDVGELARTKSLRDLSLTELRTALFCQYRSICHDDGYLTPDDLPRAQALLEEIRDRVKRRAID